MHKQQPQGKLISIDGCRGCNLIAAARKFARSHNPRDSRFSTWDASSIFYELHGSNVDGQPSPATLLLLYAADLRFRLRWQIMPALKEGHTVVAAPYVETGIAFGLAADLPRKWVTELFSFAPKANSAFWLPGAPSRLDPPTSGFLEISGFASPAFVGKFKAHFTSRAARRKFAALPFES